jgi:hypothetical protein
MTKSTSTTKEKINLKPKNTKQLEKPKTKKTNNKPNKKNSTFKLPEYGEWVFPASAEEALTFVPPPPHPLMSTVPLPPRQAEAWAKHVAERKIAYDKYRSEQIQIQQQQQLQAKERS